MSVSKLAKLCTTCGLRLESDLQRCPMDDTRLGRERPEVAVVGAYRLEERLGSGGMGAVYRAVHERLGRTVAIKMLKRSLSDKTNVARFFQEARSVNTIRHPNVVEVYDLVASGPDIYMVMEFLVGHDLHQALYLAGGHPLPLDRSLDILHQICGALQAAHDRNIVHRDLKPANVYLVQREGRSELVKVLDFGLAKLERVEGRMTREGVVVGTPEYMAPEQARGKLVSNRTDLYALGCMAYEMFTGQQLFAGGEYTEVLVRHAREPVPPLRGLNPALPEAIEGLVLRCLAKQPEQRPGSAREVAEALATASGRPFDALGAFMTDRPSLGMAAQGRPSLARASVLHSVTMKLRHARRPWLLPAITAALGLALTVWLWPRTETDEKTSTEKTTAPVAPAAGAPVPELARLMAIKLQSRPTGAMVYDARGKPLGVTPHSLVLPPGTPYRVRFSLPGHQDAWREGQADTDATVLVAMQPRRESTTREPPARTERPERRKPARDKGAPPDLDSRARTINPFDR